MDERWNEPRRLRLRWTWMKRCLADIPRPDFRVLKDARIRESMREFLCGHSGKALPPREAEFRPEILIPCFNHGRYLPLALASNTMPAIPVTVIDDASTDDTAAVLESLRARFKIKVIRNEKNLLQSGSLNKAIAGSPNNLFIILNADDLLVPYALDVLFKVLRRDAEVRLVGGGGVHFDQDATLALMNVFPRALGLSAFVPAGRAGAGAELLSPERHQHDFLQLHVFPVGLGSRRGIPAV